MSYKDEDLNIAEYMPPCSYHGKHSDNCYRFKLSKHSVKLLTNLWV
jgi:hypothetical protein